MKNQLMEDKTGKLGKEKLKQGWKLCQWEGWISTLPSAE